MKKLALAVAATVIGLVLAEGLLRLAGLGTIQPEIQFGEITGAQLESGFFISTRIFSGVNPRVFLTRSTWGTTSFAWVMSFPPRSAGCGSFWNLWQDLRDSQPSSSTSRRLPKRRPAASRRRSKPWTGPWCFCPNRVGASLNSPGPSG